jgi:hypothetical protein
MNQSITLKIILKFNFSLLRRDQELLNLNLLLYYNNEIWQV